MQLDLASLFLGLVGIAVVSVFAALAGTVSARIFFDATSESDR